MKRVSKKKEKFTKENIHSINYLIDQMRDWCIENEIMPILTIGAKKDGTTHMHVEGDFEEQVINDILWFEITDENGGAEIKEQIEEDSRKAEMSEEELAAYEIKKLNNGKPQAEA